VWHWRITGNSNVANQIGSTYMADITAYMTVWQISLQFRRQTLGFLTTSRTKKLIPGDCDDDWQPEIANTATKTGNTYISATMTDRMTVLTANYGFSTTPSAEKLTPGDCDDDGQPELVMWQPKPEIPEILMSYVKTLKRLMLWTSTLTPMFIGSVQTWPLKNFSKRWPDQGRVTPTFLRR